MNSQIEQWIRTELAGLYGTGVVAEMSEIIKLYALYDGHGQNWEPIADGTYTPTRIVTNLIKKLINDESRFMVGRPPEIRIVAQKESDKAAAEQLQDWLDRTLEGTSWRKRLLHGVRDTLIGKRVALKLSGTPGKPLTLQFLPSLEFVFEVQDDAIDRVTKCIFFYEVTPENTTDRGKQRIWRQKYWLEDGKCLMDEGLYDGYGKLLREDSHRADTGLDFVPVYIIINGGLSGDLSGESDVRELADNQLAYNRAKSDDADALKYNMFPQKVFVDASQDSMDALKIAPNAAIDLQTEPGLTGGRAAVSVLESTFNYDSRLQHYLDLLRQDMYSLLSVPQITKDALQGIGVSGKAMRAMYWDLICRCDEKWADGWDDAIRWMVERLFRMARAYGTALPEIDYLVNIDHLYPLMDDEEEERERDLNEVSRQARSRRSYIQKWHDLDDPDAELKQIREERQLLEESWAAGLE